MKQHISFIGGGNMAQSLMRGLAASGHEPQRLTASDPAPASRQAVAALGAQAVAHNQAAVDQGDLVVLAVKPQVLAEVLAGVQAPPDKLFISICAGAPMAAIAQGTSPRQPIIRAMPNTPALLRAGVTALCANAQASAAHRKLADVILGAVGKTVWVAQESLLDAATAVSGSGPAYFLRLMECMAEAGERLGLSADMAATLTVETAYGAALMARAGEAPATLRRQVTSPGGTTEAALAVLSERQFAQTIAAALQAAQTRSRTLAEEFSGA